MNYRPDIDGLRAISVLAVIIFHSGFTILSGGYVGVDIFFVISGYLITGLIYDEVKSGTFTFTNFYTRRIARLLPALIATLLIVFCFGFLFYDNKAFDNLGKEIVFSAIGAANILFGKGVNYFAQEESVRPLIHLWSLGVEEQFYLIWPTVLIFLALFRLEVILVLVSVLFSISFYFAIVTVENFPIETYFFPQYRAFELILGAFTALGIRTQHFREVKIADHIREIISYISFALIVAPMFLLDSDSTFPGVNTLYSCVGAALFIAFSYRTRVAKVLASSPLVSIGLMSYPLYLYHQPIVSYMHFFEITSNRSLMFVLVLFIAMPLSWLTYRYIEKPIRRAAKNRSHFARTYSLSLVAILGFVAVAGLFTAKTNGLEARFKVLNPFAYDVTERSASTFQKYFKRGMNVSQANSSRMLFIGDSLLQQYVYPLSKILNVDVKDIDTVTRGGCVLLKGVDFIDTFSDISCNKLREKLYEMSKHYEFIVISQGWNLYDDKILNIKKSEYQSSLAKWALFMDDTLQHFKPLANHIIIIGSHLKVEDTSRLKPTIFLTESDYRSQLTHLKVTNYDNLVKSRSFFNRWLLQGDVVVVHPLDIWLEGENEFVLHDNKWSFFSDAQHVSNVSTEYIAKKLNNIAILNHLINQPSSFP